MDIDHLREKLAEAATVDEELQIVHEVCRPLRARAENAEAAYVRVMLTTLLPEQIESIERGESVDALGNAARPTHLGELVIAAVRRGDHRGVRKAWDAYDRLEAENRRLRETARKASQRLRAVSGRANDGPKNLLDYVADIEVAFGSAEVVADNERLRGEVQRLTKEKSRLEHNAGVLSCGIERLKTDAAREKKRQVERLSERLDLAETFIPVSAIHDYEDAVAALEGEDGGEASKTDGAIIHDERNDLPPGWEWDPEAIGAYRQNSVATMAGSDLINARDREETDASPAEDTRAQARREVIAEAWEIHDRMTADLRARCERLEQALSRIADGHPDDACETVAQENRMFREVANAALDSAERPAKGPEEAPKV